jgi:hypothetical protein
MVSEKAHPSSQNPARLSGGASGGYSYHQSSSLGSYSDPSTGYSYPQKPPQKPSSGPVRGYNYPQGPTGQPSDPNGGQFPSPTPPSSTPWAVNSANNPQMSSASAGKTPSKPPLPKRKPDSLRHREVDQAKQIQDGVEDISFT